MLGVDIYPGGQSGWTPRRSLLSGPLAAAQTAKVPLVVPEFGVVVPAGATAAVLAASGRRGWRRPSTALGAAGVLRRRRGGTPLRPTQAGTFRLAQGDPGWDALRAGLAA
jgi:hypothetical protein